MIVIKNDGTFTTLMQQQQGEKYLGNSRLLPPNLLSNLKQALNQAWNGDGKPTGGYQFGGSAIWHASSGKAGADKSVTLFYYMDGPKMMVVAMGEHTAATSYELVFYGQQAGSFQYGAKINL